MIEHAALARVIAILEEADVPYMVVGSLASAHWGMPRSTNDIDIVVELDSRSVDGLLARLPQDLYYVPETLARDAVIRRTMFNVIDQETGWKIDLVVRKNRAFSRTELTRRVRDTAYGTELWLASPEDTVLVKLEWAKEGDSERHVRDVVGILSVRAGELDTGYIDTWADELGVADKWRELREA